MKQCKAERTFRYCAVDRTEFGIFEGWKEHGVTHAFSTRKGGISRGCYESLNLGYSTGDNCKDVQENFAIFSTSIDLNWKDFVCSRQSHGTGIRIAGEGDRGKGLRREADYRDVDGIVTNVPNLPLVTFHADCIPLYFVDTEKKVIGMAHAGWRGAHDGMASKMVRVMKSSFGCDPLNIQAAIGPGIGECCFHVREDVARFFQKKPQWMTRMVRISETQWRLSLESVHEGELRQEGIPLAQVAKSGVCTCCDHDRFYSHRRSGANRGTMAAVIQLD